MSTVSIFIDFSLIIKSLLNDECARYSTKTGCLSMILVTRAKKKDNSGTRVKLLSFARQEKSSYVIEETNVRECRFSLGQASLSSVLLYGKAFGKRQIKITWKIYFWLMVSRYIDIVAGLAINEQGHIVAVDSVSPTVFRITENGELIKWFDVSDRMREPSDLAIHGKEYYICDFKVNVVF